MIDRPNEGELIKDPLFVCDRCGFANVRLIDIDGTPAAKCTNCGVGYIGTRDGGERGGEG